METLKQIYPTKANISTTAKSFLIENERISDPLEISNCFCKFFTYIAKKLKNSYFGYVNTTWSKEISIPLKQNTGFRFQYVSVLEVKNILSSMNSNNQLV